MEKVINTAPHNFSCLFNLQAKTPFTQTGNIDTVHISLYSVLDSMFAKSYAVGKTGGV